jgi:succinate-acetate transporter protein
LIIFLCVEGIKVISSLLYSDESEMIKTIRLLGLIFNFSMCLLAYRGQKIATWIISVIIFFSGVTAFISSIFLFVKGHGQFGMQTFAGLYGLYFIYGGIELILIELKQQKDRRDIVVKAQKEIQKL